MAFEEGTQAQWTIRGIEARIAELAASYGPEAAGRFRNRWLSTFDTDYVTLNHALTEYEKLGYVQFLASASTQLPMNIAYLNRVAIRLNTPAVDPEIPTSVERLLHEIPVVHYYELDFNAFVTGRSTVGEDIPAVCVYGHLFAALEQLVDVVTPLVVRSSGLAEIDEIRLEASNPLYVETCASIVGCILGENASVEANEIRRLRQAPLGYRLLDFTMNGAWAFLWFHEYAHLLRGHLLDPASAELELDADEFAVRGVDLRAASMPTVVQQRGVVGVTYLFVAFHIIESIYRPSGIHPPALRRLARLSSSRFVTDVAKRILSACAPAVRARWSVDLADGLPG